MNQEINLAQMQPIVYQQLQRSFEHGRLAHAYLFEGEKGFSASLIKKTFFLDSYPLRLNSVCKRLIWSTLIVCPSGSITRTSGCSFYAVGRILPTIQSRCQVLHFQELSKEALIHRLQEEQIPLEKSKLLAFLTNSLGKAVEISSP